MCIPSPKRTGSASPLNTELLEHGGISRAAFAKLTISLIRSASDEQDKAKRVTDNTEKKLRNLKPFKPGQSGNPKGRPKGARNRLGTQFLEALEADFNQYGPQAIALVREKKPEVYMRVVADLLPKEANINVEAGEAFVELWRKISDGLGDASDEEPVVH